MIKLSKLKEEITKKLEENEIIVNTIYISVIDILENKITVDQLLVSLYDIHGIEISEVKRLVNEVCYKYNVEIEQYLLEI